MRIKFNIDDIDFKVLESITKIYNCDFNTAFKLCLGLFYNINLKHVKGGILYTYEK